MLYTSLTKSEKKLSQELIRKGLSRECEKFIGNIKSQVNNTDSDDYYTQYLDLFKVVDSFDKHISEHYDGLTGGHYLECVAYLRANELITDDEIAGYTDDAKNWIVRACELFGK